MEKSLSYPGKLADADIKISRRCPAGEPTVAVPSEAKEGKQC